MPLYQRLEAHVLSAERLHGDDTTVPVLAKGKTGTGRIWVYVRDDNPASRLKAERADADADSVAFPTSH